MTAVEVREVEPCTCSHGLNKHAPVSGRPCTLCPCLRWAPSGELVRMRRR